MARRYLSIWFCYLKTDWFTRQHTNLKNLPFVFATPIHGRMVVTAINQLAEKEGVVENMVVADARAFIHSLQVFDDIPDLSNKLLKKLAVWCIRFAPIAAIDLPNGIMLDITGCAHLWGNEEKYQQTVKQGLNKLGYQVRVAIADTIGTAWAIARFGKDQLIVPAGASLQALFPLPPPALRLDINSCERLQKLGLHQIHQFIRMPRNALRRRFGNGLLTKLDQALGNEIELLQPVIPPEPYQLRLPSIEPIITATGIEIALHQLLENLCTQLIKEEKGIRMAVFKCFRVDGKIESIQISTSHPSQNTKHLFKLFENKIASIEPDLGIELFILEAPKLAPIKSLQEKLWVNENGLQDLHLAELIDRLAIRIGNEHILRFLPDEHYWPERSIKPAKSLQDNPATTWRLDNPRPIQLLNHPEPIEVTAPIPDYPPMLFRYKGKLHKIIRADGPERIEQEWWIQEGQHRDYYYVEDEAGNRYWLFRSGHYAGQQSNHWYLHGFFA